jgi:hypothetical protein
MNMVALANGRDDAADVFTVFDHGITDRQVFQSNLVPEGHVLVEDASKLTVILGYDAEQVGTGSEILDDHYADVVAAVVHEQMRYLVHDDPRVTRAIYKG